MSEKLGANQAHSATGRRDFMKAVAAGAVAATVGPNILARAEEGNDTVGRTGVMGVEGHRYEWVEGWAKLPEGKQFGNTHAIREVEDGRVFVHNQSPTGDCTAIFDPEGKFIESWGPEYTPGAHGMDYNKEDGVEYLYLATTGMHRVVKTTLTGEKLFEFGYPKESGLYEDESKFNPTNIAIAPNGDFYVADGYGLGYIHQYSKKAEYIRSWGGGGKEPGKMSCPHGIHIDMRGETPAVVVADRGNERLQYFTLDGELIRVEDITLSHPCHFDRRGDDLLIPGLFGVVSILNKKNEVITRLGDNPACKEVQGWPNIAHEKRLPGKFSSPHGASWDRAGNILVAEWIPDGRVTKLRRVD